MTADLRRLIADDAFAASFQTLGQYRAALLSAAGKVPTRGKYVNHNGKCQTITEWAKEYDLPPIIISQRLRLKWSIEKALTTPASHGYEEGKRRAKERARKIWAQKGKQYKANSLAKKTAEQ